MKPTEMIAALSHGEKVILAAQLTQAAMSHSNLGPLPNVTPQDAAKVSADRAYMVFGYLLTLITEGQQPMRFPEKG